jgi:hypothetical protein
VPTDKRVAPQEPRPSFSGARLGLAAAAALAFLAVVETAQALIAPSRVPTTADWNGVAANLRAGFRGGDLIVAAPAWADPVMRQYLGDLLPIAVAARMDDARFGRVWEVSQHGARAAEASVGAVAFERRFGALTLRRVERRAAEVTFDFLQRWQEAYVTRWDPASRVSSPCPWQTDRFSCPTSGNNVLGALVEVDTRIRRAILAPPVLGAIVAVEFPAVPLGRELAVAVGLHDAWARKSPGSVFFEVWIAGQPSRATIVDNRSGWSLLRIDTSARMGQMVPVRFQISAQRPELRQLAFAAEARR